MTTVPCLCGNAVDYHACCGRFIDADQWPATAQALMRSRYSAYCLSRTDYLLATWHHSTRPASLECSAAQKWLGLRIITTQQGGEKDTHGVVEFVARYKVGGARAERLHEVSEFLQIDGRWYYVQGQLKG